MTTLRSIPAPTEVVETVGDRGGYWFRFDDADAHALIWWKGGPKSPDRDVILHDIEATPPGFGHGTELLKQILDWADRKNLNVSLICPQERSAWYGRHGFLRLEARYGDIVMGRTPRKVTGGLVIPR